jgi:hypothetical protein
MRFKSTEIATIAVAGVALIGSVVSAFYTYANRNRELDIKLVEIGIGILRTDPNGADLASARAWAIQVIEDNSKVKFSAGDRESLLKNPLLYRPTTGARQPQPIILRGLSEDVANVQARDFELQGGIVQKTKDADGTWTITVFQFP